MHRHRSLAGCRSQSVSHRKSSAIRASRLKPSHASLSITLSARYLSLFVALRQPSFEASARQPRVVQHVRAASPTHRVVRTSLPSRACLPAKPSSFWVLSTCFVKGNCYNLDIGTSLLGKRVLLLKFDRANLKLQNLKLQMETDIVTLTAG
ncbi:uncharacterized protein E5676_scaffold9G00170 [Cucumis melo var. makuwa]|uniref:Uncharacterized protein n=1 Tax=Cucumis melo var. makuwa TaxID=1194695 RepID=A0A5D3D7V0_CUCMM|nr:uncharacterized protein E6C27_scaffold845G00520 [Cucumis melo var. makuwa]TYK19612.1 uncharacterized protein E5676_scaffold9G00170 [Cucumis melo var. makuwa]